MIFAAGFNLKKKDFFKNFGPCFLYAVVGTALSAGKPCMHGQPSDAQERMSVRVPGAKRRNGIPLSFLSQSFSAWGPTRRCRWDLSTGITLAGMR